MSTPPQQPGPQDPQRPGPQDQPPPSYSTEGYPQYAAAAPPPKPGAGWWALAGVIALAVGIGGYFVGKTIEGNKYDPGQPDYEAIYNKGAAAGTAAGTEAGAKAGLQEGAQKGFDTGKKEGESAGVTKGREEGATAGAQAALGGFTDWQTGVPYVTTLASGPSQEVPYAVQSRTLMVQGKYYGICSSGSGVCVLDRSAEQQSGG